MKKKISILGSTGSIGRQALDVIRNLKDKFEIVICKSDFPISELKYSIGFKINNDGVWAHIPQEDCELLEGVFNYD